MSDTRVDVLIVGLGPAGACAAASAARRGARVLAVDRRREPGVPVQCAEFVPAMLGIDVDPLARSIRQPIASMATFVEDDAPDVTEPFPGQMIDRAAFDAALVADAIEAGAKCRFATSVRAIARDGRVRLSDGLSVGTDVIVGADGPRSIVGRAIGRVNTALVETRQITVALLEPHAATDIFLSASIPGGYGWLFPKSDVANVGAGVVPAHRGRLKAIVDRLHAMLIAKRRVGEARLCVTGGAIPVGGMLEPRAMLGATCVLLAGDAVGLANPVTGAGIAAAVQSGTLAGEAAAAVVAGDRNAPNDFEDELRSLFGGSLARALRRRRELARTAHPDKTSLRRAWVGYDEYWAA
jgi:geranylgeranyl reductase family protein